MKYICYILCIFLHLITSLDLQAENLNKEVKDSLLRIYLTSPPDTSRLIALHAIAQLDQSSPVFIYYQNKLLKEAVAQKNILYQSMAIYAHTAYYCGQSEQAHAEQWLRELEKFSEQNSFYEHYFKGKKKLIELYILNGKVEIAIQQAQEMYDKAEKLNNKDGICKACICLFNGYFATLRYKEGLAALEKAFNLVNSDLSANVEVELLTKAVLAYSYLHDNKNQYQHTKELEAAKNKLQNINDLDSWYQDLCLLIEIQYSLYYSRTLQSAKALEHLQETDKCISDSTFPPYQLALLGAYTEYFQLIKDYPKALYYLDKAIQAASTNSSEEMLAIGLQKADILVKMGRAEEALPLYKKITKAKDSLYTVFSASQIEQIQSMSNLDKLILETEKRQATFQYICLITIIIIIVVLILFNIRMYNSRKRLELDEKEMRKLADIAEKANEIKSHFLANMSYNIRIPLNNVVGFSQILSTDTSLSEEERNEYSAIIQQNTAELTQLVNDILDLSRLEAGMMKFQLQEISLAECCHDLSSMVQMRSENHILLKLEKPQEDIRINTDINRFIQFILNMLLYPEACQEEREIRMTISCLPKDNIISCKIENSPMADIKFTSSKVSIRHKINQLFFEYFGGSYEVKEAFESKASDIIFTYPILS